MTTSKHRRPGNRGATVVRLSLATGITLVAGLGTLTGWADAEPAGPAAPGVVVAPAVSAAVPPSTTAPGAAAPAIAPAGTTPAQESTDPGPTATPTAAQQPRRTSTPARSHHTESELRDRARTLTGDDLREGRGSMPDGGLTSGESQLVYGCEQGYIPASQCG